MLIPPLPNLTISGILQSGILISGILISAHIEMADAVYKADYLRNSFIQIVRLPKYRPIVLQGFPNFLDKDPFFVLYCIVLKYLYSAPQQPWANRGAFGSISSKKRHKLTIIGVARGPPILMNKFYTYSMCFSRLIN